MSSIFLNALLQLNILLSAAIVILTVARGGRRFRFYSLLTAANASILLFIFGALIWLFTSDRFAYYHVWSHSSSELSPFFKVAAIWEGQEGSLFLWAFFQNFVSIYFLLQKKHILRMVGAVLLIWQILLLIPATDFGYHDPADGLFVLAWQKLQLDPETLQAKWLLRDGKGMNPLLENFWMVVHPPVIFLAFSFSCVPYALCLTALFFQRSFPIQRVSMWLKYSLIILSSGILMGAYWAYETLNFGGYWSWDPVENAIYLPWLIGVAALHVNWLGARHERYLRLSWFLNSLYFLFVVYSTFLTRSGVLSGISVHSFVDSGYYTYFLTLLLAVAVAAITVFILRRKKFSSHIDQELVFCRSDYAFLVALVLMLAALQIFISVSIPVFSRWSSDLGFPNQAAPISDPLHYSRWQGGWVMVMLSLFITLESNGKLRATILVTLMMAILLVASRLLVLDVVMAGVILGLSFLLLGVLLLRSVRALLFSNGLRKSTLAHTGFVVLLVGVICSNSILTGGSNGRHTLLLYDEPKAEGKSFFAFDGKFRKTKEGHLISAGSLKGTSRSDRFIAKDSILLDNRLITPGEVLRIDPHNLFFKIRHDNAENSRTFFNRVHFKSHSDYFITPEIHHSFFGDLYFHISNFSDDEKIEWKEFDDVDILPGMTASGRVDLLPLKSIPGMTFGEGETGYLVCVKTNYRERKITLAPLIILGRNGELVFTQGDANEMAGIAVEVLRWKDRNHFSLRFYSAGPGYVTILAEKKPFINFFWIGSCLIILGFIRSIPSSLLSSVRRLQAFKYVLPVVEKKIEITHENIQDQSAQRKTV